MFFHIITVWYSRNIFGTFIFQHGIFLFPKQIVGPRPKVWKFGRLSEFFVERNQWSQTITVATCPPKKGDHVTTSFDTIGEFEPSWRDPSYPFQRPFIGAPFIGGTNKVHLVTKFFPWGYLEVPFGVRWRWLPSSKAARPGVPSDGKWAVIKTHLLDMPWNTYEILAGS